MESLLALPKQLEMSETEKAEMDRLIENSITVYKNNAAVLYKLALDALTVMTAGPSRLEELGQRGFFDKLWTQLAGQKQELGTAMDINKIQYASQKLLKEFTEQKLFSFDLVTAANNKLNTMVLEMGEEVGKVYQMLGAFFKQTRSDLIQLDARLDKIERNVELLHWNATIEYQMYRGTEYMMLSEKEKIVCLSNDFFHRTKGNWTTADLMILKSTLGELGMQTKQMISSGSFYASLIEKPELIDRLFEGISLDGLLAIEPFEAPLIKGVEKARKIHTEEKYIVDTVKTQLELAKVAYNDREVQLSIIHQFLKNMAYSNTDCQVNLFDFVLELLMNLKLVDESGKKAKLAADTAGQTAAAEENIYDVVLFTYGDDKYRLIEGLSALLSIKLEDAKKIAGTLPATVLSHVTKERAEEIAAGLNRLGAKAKAKTIIETYHEVLAPINGKVYFTDENPYQILQAIIPNQPKYFVQQGDAVDEGTVLAVIYKSAMMIGLEDPFVRAGVKGKVLEITAEHKQEVKKGDLLMIIRADA